MNPFDLGQAAVLLSRSAEKLAAATPLSYGMRGRLVFSPSGYVLLDVPNDIGNGAFKALSEPGIEQPISSSRGHYNAHVSVMRPEEVEKIGGPDKIKERGHTFAFNLGAVREIANPHGWDEVSKCWAIDIKSPELMKLRRGYGLGDPKFPFHLTIAIRKKHALKSASLIHFTKSAAQATEIKSSPIHGKGLFATSDFMDGDIILPKLMVEAPSDDGRTRWEQSEQARFTNHSENPNTEVVREDGYVKLRASRDIKAGEELTASYDKTSAHLGPGFYYTWQGKPYNGETDEDDQESSDVSPFGEKRAITRHICRILRHEKTAAEIKPVPNLAPKPSAEEADEEKKRLERAVNRNQRERKARRIAAARDKVAETIQAYKQFRTLKSDPGGIYPLFIDKSNAVPEGAWLEAENIPTKGFAPRPGWHAGALPAAPHLRSKEDRIQPDRVWAEVELPANVDWQAVADQRPTKDIRDEVPKDGYYRKKTPQMQGGEWLIGGGLKVNKQLTDDEVSAILRAAGELDAAEKERRKAAAAKCPGCNKPFPKGEPYPDVEMCEACERFGPPKLVKEGVALVAQIASARKVTKSPKSEAQAEAGNYPKGKVRMHGFQVVLENPKGSTRSGTDPSGKSWSVKMQHDYGYISRTVGKDGDHVDVFVGPDPDAELVYVVDQQDPTSRKFDEHKCMLGFTTEASARDAYLSNYEDNWKGLKSITALTMPQFKWWLKNGDMKKPVAGAKVKVATDSYYLNAINQTPMSWDTQQGVAQNLMQNLNRVRKRGDRAIQEAGSFDRLQNAMDPDRASRQLSAYLAGTRQPAVSHPLDQFIQEVGT